MNRLEYIEDEDFIEAFNSSLYRSDICKKLNIHDNGASRKFINDKIRILNLDMKILETNRFNKYHIKKKCPVCGKEFYTTTTAKESKQVCCSYSCSNTYFRSGENNGMYKATIDNFAIKQAHVKICFRFHPHICCVCGEKRIVAVHHYDNNHKNNDVTNLVPLCPTHHIYMHSRYKDEIKDKVDKYHDDFIKKYKK